MERKLSLFFPLEISRLSFMTSSPPPGLLQITLHGSQSVVGSSQAPEEEEEEKKRSYFTCFSSFQLSLLSVFAPELWNSISFKWLIKLDWTHIFIHWLLILMVIICAYVSHDCLYLPPTSMYFTYFYPFCLLKSTLASVNCWMCYKVL